MMAQFVPLQSNTMFKMTFNGESLFLITLETWKSKSKTRAYLVSTSWLVQGIFLLCPYVAEGIRQ